MAPIAIWVICMSLGTCPTQPIESPIWLESTPTLTSTQETRHTHAEGAPSAQYRTPTPEEHVAVARWESLVATHFPADQIGTTLCVLWGESAGVPTAKNPDSTARGLMQILASLWAPHYGLAYNDLYDPDTNMWVARKVWDDWGWGAWSAYKRGRVQQCIQDKTF